MKYAVIEYCQPWASALRRNLQDSTEETEREKGIIDYETEAYDEGNIKLGLAFLIRGTYNVAKANE